MIQAYAWSALKCDSVSVAAILAMIPKDAAVQCSRVASSQDMLPGGSQTWEQTDTVIDEHMLLTAHLFPREQNLQELTGATRQ